MTDTSNGPRFYLQHVEPRECGDEELLVFQVLLPTNALGRRDFLKLGAAIPAAAVLATVWDEPVSAADAVLLAHRSAVGYLLASSDGSTLVSIPEGSSDAPKRWQLPGGTSLGAFRRGRSSEGGWVVTPDGRHIARCSNGRLTIASFEGELSDARLDIPDNLTTITATSSGFAALGGTRIVLVGVPASGEPRIENTIDAVFSVACLAATETAVVGGMSDGSIRTWNRKTGAPEGHFEVGTQVLSMLRIPGEAAVVTAHSDRAINVVSIRDGARVSLGQLADLAVLALGPERDSVVAATSYGVIEAFSMLTGDRFRQGEVDLGSGVRVTALTPLPKNSRLAVGTSAGEILLLDWPSLEVRGRLFDPSANRVSVRGTSYRLLDPTTGRTVTFTQPCGTPIPPGATCVCNCVPGTIAPPAPPPRRIPNPEPGPGGRSLTRPCTPTPIPPGYICTCNCVPGF